MKKLNTIIGLILFGFTIFGCQSTDAKQEVKAKVEAKKEPKRVIVMGFDSTGSYHLFDKAKNIGIQIIRELKPEDIFYYRRIDGASYLDNCTIFRLELPPLPKNRGNENPFDRKSKNLHRLQVYQINSLKEEAIKRLNSVNSINANRTDVTGFLAAAADRFSIAPKQSQRVLIIASDLEDNIGYNINLDFSDVYVAVLGFQNSKDPRNTRRLKDKWTKKFMRAGVKKVIFLGAEEIFSIGFFRKT